MLSSGNFAILQRDGLLDEQGHPIIAAFEKAINTVSSDVCSLCRELWEHANKCEICQKRANDALNNVRKRKLTT